MGIRKQKPSKKGLSKEQKEALLKEILPFRANETARRHNEKVIFTHIASTMPHLISESAIFNEFEDNFAKDIDECEGNSWGKFYAILPILQKHYCSFKLERLVKQNIKFLQTHLHLKPLEIDILYFFYIMNIIASDFKQANFREFIKCLSSFFHTTEYSIHKLLEANAPLRKVRFLRKDYRFMFEVNDFVKDFFVYPLTKHNVLKKMAQPVKPTKLNIEDFSYMQEDITMLLDFFKKTKNPSIYLYGAPGVGKNEIASLLAKSLHKELFKISKNFDYEKEQYFQAFIIAQNLLESKNNIVLFDECEDIFKDYSLRAFSFEDSKKGLFNEMLESIQVPSIFLSNSCDIDPAFLRRFDIVLEIKVPPKAKRIQMIQSTLSTHKIQIDTQIIDKIAEHNLSTGILLNSLRVAKSAPKGKTTQSVLKIINEHLKLQDKREIILQKTSSELPYSMDLINADIDVSRVSKGIQNAKCGARILLYGVPGSGKSAYAKALAETLQKEIVLKKGSDLLSKWVGGTEKNIASAFKEAQENNAILVFDEVDSFLQDRSEAQRSWEVTQTNEMLTQMESFEGVFIATTNSFLCVLDDASIRRFDMKISFKPLDGLRLKKAFVMYATYLGLKDAQDFVKSYGRDFAHLDNVCLGDFALIARSANFMPFECCDALFDRLLKESSLKQSSINAKVGFRIKSDEG